MLFLVATKETQGKRKSDFSWTTDGEPVMFGSECDGEKVDGKCGCKRAMSGVTSAKATTTMKVADVSEDAIRAGMVGHLVKNWGFDEAEAKEYIEDQVKELHRIAEFFGEGTVLERRGRQFGERS
mgnify:CR=1 FL=1